MREVLRTAALAAKSKANVLVLGESGTGKERVARLIHDRSSRPEGPFVAVDCAAIPESLFESEFYGHERGAFTGAIRRKVGDVERASGGTLFLDEIGNLPLGSQAKILRALQERRIRRVGGDQTLGVDIRVIAATNRDLASDVAAGRFREDLYYRLNVIALKLPRLRERGGVDIALLAEHFLRRFAHDHALPLPNISPEVMNLLRAHPWPGNVRQLENAIECAVVLCEGTSVELEHLPPEVRIPELPPLDGHHVSFTLAELERNHIDRVLTASHGNIGRAAELLGIHRNTLRHKMRKYGIAR